MYLALCERTAGICLRFLYALPNQKEVGVDASNHVGSYATLVKIVRDAHLFGYELAPDWPRAFVGYVGAVRLDELVEAVAQGGEVQVAILRGWGVWR